MYVLTERLIADFPEGLWCMAESQTMGGGGSLFCLGCPGQGGLGWDGTEGGGEEGLWHKRRNSFWKSTFLHSWTKTHCYSTSTPNDTERMQRDTQFSCSPPIPIHSPNEIWLLVCACAVAGRQTYPIEFNNDEGRRLLVFRRWEADRGCSVCHLASWNTTRFKTLPAGHIFCNQQGE